MAQEGKKGGGLGSALLSGAMGLGQALGGALGMKREAKYARKQAKYEMELQKQLNQYNQGLAMQMWENTNYAAQVKQLQKAGLNVGLMYEGGGQGGTTNTPAGGNVSVDAPKGNYNPLGMGIDRALQMQMQQAQIKLAEASADKTQTEADKLKGVDTEETKANIENIQVKTENQRINNEIAQYEKQIKAIQANITKETEQTAINSIKQAAHKLRGEAQSALTKGEIDRATYDEIVKQAEQQTQIQALDILAKKKGLTKTDAEIRQIYNAVEQLKQNTEINWFKLSVDEKEQKIKQKLQEFIGSDAAQIKQWTDIVMQVMTLGLANTGGGNPIGFQY